MIHLLFLGLAHNLPIVSIYSVSFQILLYEIDDYSSGLDEVTNYIEHPSHHKAEALCLKLLVTACHAP